MGSDEFEPPKYLATLITAVNDGGKAAQAGALFFALVGIYLLATAFSATDEDLLLGRALTISQIGATLPITFSFAIAPLVFVFLHIYTLVRYHMVATNVRQFLTELGRTVPSERDRERCRQLLANIEFIQALVVQPGSLQYSPVWRWLVWWMVAGFPVFVLLLVQINALRYQSEFITLLQRLILLIDMFALVCFFHRNPLREFSSQRRLALTRRWARLCWLPLAVIFLNLLYLNVVPVQADVEMVRYARPPEQMHKFLADALNQPLDVMLCPSLNWGCRYLRVEHRTLINRTYDDKAINELRSGGAHTTDALTAIDGVVLRNRSLRFASLEAISLFAADLTNSDLRKANLAGANLQGARLDRARLEDAELSLARLMFAQLRGAELQGAHLYLTQLQGANLMAARLQRVSLRGAQLQRAELLSAQLWGADLAGAQLQGASLEHARLEGASLGWARLQGANLKYAQLQGANLSEARLQGALLQGAQLEGTDLRRVRLWRARFDAKTDLGLADLRGADFATKLTEVETKDLQATLDAIRDSARNLMIKEAVRWANEEAEELSSRLLGTEQSTDRLLFTASAERQVLVSDPKNPVFEKIPTEWLIGSPTPSYADALEAWLLDQSAPQAPDIAKSVAAGAAGEIVRRDTDDKSRSLYGNIACRLLANARADKLRLSQPTKESVSRALDDQKIPCEAAIRPLPPLPPGIREAIDVIVAPD
jgi:uncharacterized protein YjbI with pentapeptide repeats